MKVEDIDVEDAVYSNSQHEESANQYETIGPAGL